MAGPGDEIATGAGGFGRLRASHADREQVISVLKAAFVQGRLERDEFDVRIGRALAARTYADLATVTADLPAGLTAARRSRRAARVQLRRPVNRGVKWGAYGLVTPAILASAAAVSVLSGSDAIAMPAMTIAFLYFVLWLFVGADLFAEWRKERSRGQSPPRSGPSAGGQPSQRLAAASADQLAPADDDRRHGAEAARSHLPRPRMTGSLAPRRWRAGGCRYAVGQA